IERDDLIAVFKEVQSHFSKEDLLHLDPEEVASGKKPPPLLLRLTSAPPADSLPAGRRDFHELHESIPGVRLPALALDQLELQPDALEAQINPGAVAFLHRDIAGDGDARSFDPVAAREEASNQELALPVGEDFPWPRLLGTPLRHAEDA